MNNSSQVNRGRAKTSPLTSRINGKRSKYMAMNEPNGLSCCREADTTAALAMRCLSTTKNCTIQSGKPGKYFYCICSIPVGAWLVGATHRDTYVICLLLRQCCEVCA